MYVVLLDGRPHLQVEQREIVVPNCGVVSAHGMTSGGLEPWSVHMCVRVCCFESLRLDRAGWPAGPGFWKPRR